MTPAELEQLKRNVSLVEVAQSQGRKLRKQGKDFVTLCPFHREKTPSCVISPARNLYHCFGCNAGGSVLDWLQHTERLTYPQTLVRLRDLAGSSSSLPPASGTMPAASSRSASVSVAPSPSSSPARQILTDLDDDGQALLYQVTDWYHRNLLNSPETLAWLEKRGLNHPDLVSHFRLGFAGAHGVAGALPSPHSKEGKALRSRLTALGVIRESNRQDHFRGCLTVPVTGWAECHDPASRGRVLQVYGRRTMPDHQIKKGSARHLYLPSPLCGVWNEAALVAASEVILCEALIDAMTFWCAGYRNVIAAYGVNGFTASHLAALQYHGVKRVMIAFDRDEAGDRGAETVAAELAGYLRVYAAEMEKEYGTAVSQELVKGLLSGQDYIKRNPDSEAMASAQKIMNTWGYHKSNASIGDAPLIFGSSVLGTTIKEGMALNAAIGVGVNAGVQLSGNDPFSYVDVIMAGVTAAATTGKGIITSAPINMGGAAVSSGIKGENPVNSVAGAAAGTVVGGIGGEIIKGAASKLGKDAISDLTGAVLGGYISEKTGNAVKDHLDEKDDANAKK
ncbi:toprim domain-containing protein [Erwinia psidii]|uniref:Toprim domain-containing protein n=3 Tax=Erwinia psidii TaxID=69224 RepID=A0A3N6V3P5_9GAMM|nr:CHC2 zinc finger domain-containing protein [Erwinia psidii]RQM39725.1 toprim domain-containing protein [Erwinia psidii]